MFLILHTEHNRMLRKCGKFDFDAVLKDKTISYMPLDATHFLARIVVFFHSRIRVFHTLRINHQESGCFITSLLVALRNHLIF